MLRIVTILYLSLLMLGCSGSGKSKTLTVATTTSTQDSGLLGVIVPMFTAETGIDVKILAVGSGQAIELGRRGDADVLLTHAPTAELKFLSEGFADQRLSVMHNDFVLVGAKSDSAHVRETLSINEAFRRIAQQNSLFISRGDESGTHQKEREIWDQANHEPKGEWYVRSGTGMAAALRMASEKQAYTLSDRSTFLFQREKLDLAILFEGDHQLQNPYSVMVVSAQKHPNINHVAATQFAQFLRSPEIQREISNYGVQQFGQPLFFVSDPSITSD